MEGNRGRPARAPGAPHGYKHRRSPTMPLQARKRFLIDGLVAVIKGEDEGMIRKRLPLTQTIDRLGQRRGPVAALLQLGHRAPEQSRRKGNGGRLVIEAMKSQDRQ